MKNTTTTARAIDFLSDEMLHSLPVRVEIDGKPYDKRVSEAVDLLKTIEKPIDKIVIISLLYTYTITANEITKQANY